MLRLESPRKEVGVRRYYGRWTEEAFGQLVGWAKRGNLPVMYGVLLAGITLFFGRPNRGDRAKAAVRVAVIGSTYRLNDTISISNVVI